MGTLRCTSQVTLPAPSPVLASQRTCTSLVVDRSPVDRSGTDLLDARREHAFAIRSERLISREARVKLAHRWFCKLGIEDAVADHSAFSRCPQRALPLPTSAYGYS